MGAAEAVVGACDAVGDCDAVGACDAVGDCVGAAVLAEGAVVGELTGEAVCAEGELDVGEALVGATEVGCPATMPHSSTAATPARAHCLILADGCEKRGRKLLTFWIKVARAGCVNRPTRKWNLIQNPHVFGECYTQ